MAAMPGEEDNELNFSDSDSDNDDNRENAPRQMIAHKEMKPLESVDTPNDSPANDFEAISPADSPKNDTPIDNITTENANKDIENDAPIDNVDEGSTKHQTDDPSHNYVEENNDVIKNDAEENFEPISPDTEQVEKNDDNRDFENISDHEEDRQTSNENFAVEKPESNNVVSEIENNDILPKNENIDSNIKDDELSKHLDEVEAPVPSPLSDIGDDAVGTDNTVSKILNESQDGSESPDFDVDLESDKTKDENTEELKSSAESSVAPVESNQTRESDDLEHSADADVSNTNVDVEETTGLPEVPPTDDPMEDQDDLIADIFGDSDEEEEFEGFLDEELPPDQSSEPVAEPSREKADESSDEEDTIPSRDFVSDFDLMLQKRKEMNRMKRRSKKDFDVINDNDDIIAAMIRQMKDAAEEDRMLNQAGKAATKKLKMLPSVLNHLRKADLQSAFIDCGVLPAIKEWLTPLPDHALPHINIRKVFLKMLGEFPPLDKGALKMSGIGRAVMLLFKHPKETSENKKIAGKIISNWARPIFNVSTNFNELTREERENRDKQNIPEAKRRRLSSGDMSNRQTLNDDDDGGTPRKPGDKGWIGRARVPMPSHRDYVNRPVSKVESYDFAKSGKQSLSRYEKHARRMKDKKSVNSGTRKAVGISLNGSKMAL